EQRHADYVLIPQATPPVSVYRIAPALVHRPAADRFLIDFGQALTGQFEMRAKGAEGQVIELRYGEELEPDGLSVKYEMRCNCRYLETWTLSGREDEDTLEPFEYK